MFEVGGSVCEALKPDLCVSYRSYNYIGSIAHNDIIILALNFPDYGSGEQQRF